jgi:hypothetical protein
MKTTLKILMLLLAASFPCVAFAGLLGIAPPAAFYSGEIVFSLFAIAGLALIGLNDYSRRPIPVHTAATKAAPVVTVGSSRRDRACAVHPWECASA